MRDVSNDDLAEVLGTRESTTLEFKRTAKREGKRGDAIATAVFELKAADGALGSTQKYVQTCYRECKGLAENVLDRVADR